MKFKLQGMDILKNWEENLTWEGILELEANGSDVADIKKKYIARKKKEEEEYIAEQKRNKEEEELSSILRFTMQEVNDNINPNKTNLSKLDSIKREIKNPDSKIVKDLIGKKPLLFGKSKWIKGVKNSEILYTSVIQCHPQLWQEVTLDITPALTLLVYSMNPKYSKNIEILKSVSKYLNIFGSQEEIDKAKYSKKMIQLYNDLNNPQSMPHLILDSTILNDLNLNVEADIRVTSSFVYQFSPLPNKKLPSNGIIPYIRYKKLDTKTNFGFATRIIDSKYYTN